MDWKDLSLSIFCDSPSHSVAEIRTLVSETTFMKKNFIQNLDQIKILQEILQIKSASIADTRTLEEPPVFSGKDFYSISPIFLHAKHIHPTIQKESEDIRIIG
ncbi:hypothetical protein JW968_03665 [Candidatus Woesearchaeota archaeon]|nr:hypothetical protein [Candidatus Woesearchaeota archaeon]